MASKRRAAGRDWLTVPETAWLLQVSERHVHQLLKAGELAAYELTVGSRTRLSVDAVERRAGLRALLVMDDVLAGRRPAPRAARPWKQPPSLQ
jgi:excisionase family DNA binding protein